MANIEKAAVMETAAFIYYLSELKLIL